MTITETLCATTSCSSRAIRARSSVTARREASATARREASPSTHATNAKTITNVASSCDAVSKFSAVSAARPASPHSEMRGTRVAASVKTAMSPANGSRPSGAIDHMTKPPASAIAVATCGCERRHHSAAPCTAPASIPPTRSAEVRPVVSSTMPTRKNATRNARATSAAVLSRLRWCARTAVSPICAGATIGAS